MRRFTILLRLATLAMIAGAFYVSASTHSAPMGGFVGVVTPSHATFAPTFTAQDARQHPRCDANVAHPRAGWVDLLVVDGQGARHRATYDATRAQQARGLERWVIGVCY